MKERNRIFYWGVLFVIYIVIVIEDFVIKSAETRLCIDLVIGIIILTGWWISTKTPNKPN